MAEFTFSRPNIRKLVDMVTEFTDQKFGLSGTGMDLGNGSRFMDMHSQTVWLGHHGARECTAYMVGGALGWAYHTGKEIPQDMRDYLQRAQREYAKSARYFNWETQGRERAASLSSR